MPPRRRKKKDERLSVSSAPAAPGAKRPPRFFMQKLSDGSERVVRFRSRADGCRDQAMADFFGAGPELESHSNMRSMDSLLAELMDTLQLEESLAPEILAAAWRQAAGAGLSSMSELISVARSTASIRVGHPTVRYELTRLKSQIIRALNAELGAGSVRYVRFISR